MSSQARINASCANGKLSRGPKTDDGKRRSSQNARRHGLLSATLPLEGESAERFAESRQSLITQWNPQDEVERMLVGRAALHNYRYFEAMRMETDLINAAARARSEQEPAVRVFTAIAGITKQSNILEVLHRYACESSFRYDRTLTRLASYRKSDIHGTNLTLRKSDIHGTNLTLAKHVSAEQTRAAR